MNAPFVGENVKVVETQPSILSTFRIIYGSSIHTICNGTNSANLALFLV